MIFRLDQGCHTSDPQVGCITCWPLPHPFSKGEKVPIRHVMPPWQREFDTPELDDILSKIAKRELCDLREISQIWGIVQFQNYTYGILALKPTIFFHDL